MQTSTINYALPRTLIAAGQLINLIFTPHNFFFNNVYSPILKDPILPNLFQIFEAPLVTQIVSFGILIFVISGYLPQISGALHAWFSHSFLFCSLIIEGGDQLAQILTILLLPICMFDKKLNHWDEKEYFHYKLPDIGVYFVKSCLIIIQFQMSIVYLFAAAMKLKGNEWMEGSAFYYWFNHQQWGAPNWMHFLGDWVIQNHYISPLFTWGTVILEFLLFAGFFMTQENKRNLFWFALAFHILIALCMGLWAFSLIMVAGLILYLIPYNKTLKTDKI